MRKLFASLVLFFTFGAFLSAADLVITPASVVQASGQPETGKAGGTITAGMAVYKDAADGDKIKPADSNASVDTARVVGIALHGATNNQPIAYATAGDINPGATVVVGTTYIVSATAGGIAPIGDATSGWFVGYIGYATTASNIRLMIKPTGVQVP